MSMQIGVDIVIFTVQNSALKILLTRRAKPPFKGRMAIPGRSIGAHETLERAALRELKEETGARSVYLEQLYSFDDPRRDPRGRMVTVAYYALVPGNGSAATPGNGSGAEWRRADRLPPLAFDHRHIVDYALERLRNKLEYTTVGFQLLPRKFTLPELQTVYETILGKKLDKRNFRKKMDLLGILKPLREYRRTGRKPARLYSFIPRKFEKLKDKGILFPF
jgi:8-oxo-dGTP diphosphatase